MSNIEARAGMLRLAADYELMAQRARNGLIHRQIQCLKGR
jgi:hypothetical protein